MSDAPVHADPPEGTECKICMGELDEDNYVEYTEVEGAHLWVACSAVRGCRALSASDCFHLDSRGVLSLTVRAALLPLAANASLTSSVAAPPRSVCGLRLCCCLEVPVC